MKSKKKVQKKPRTKLGKSFKLGQTVYEALFDDDCGEWVVYIHSVQGLIIWANGAVEVIVGQSTNDAVLSIYLHKTFKAALAECKQREEAWVK